MKRMGIEITGEPGGKAAEYFDLLKKQFPEGTVKAKNQDGKIESGWEIFGFDSTKKEVLIIKLDPKYKRIADRKSVPLAEFLVQQQ